MAPLWILVPFVQFNICDVSSWLAELWLETGNGQTVMQMKQYMPKQDLTWTLRLWQKPVQFPMKLNAEDESCHDSKQ